MDLRAAPKALIYENSHIKKQQSPAFRNAAKLMDIISSCQMMVIKSIFSNFSNLKGYFQQTNKQSIQHDVVDY